MDLKNSTFWGYKRENGRIGVRNHVIILPVDDLSNAAAEAVAHNIKGALAIPHPYGRLQFGANLDLHFATLIGTGCNPNVAAVVVICIEDGWAKKVADGILSRHGRIDILVNSAGLNTPNRYWKNQTVDGWREVIGINLDGSFYTIHAVLPAMRARKDGLIINVSSWAGVFHPKLTGAAYNGSKHAVTAMTETINMEECANGIRACAVCPAEVATPIMDRRPVPPSAADRAKMLQPEDLGNTIRFIAELPAHACINQLIISPTWNRMYIENL